MNCIERYIERNATLYPDKTAIVCDGEHCTYSMLQERISRKAAALQEAGCREGQIVCLRALPTVDYLVDYFAYHVAGCVVAPLEKDLPEASFQKIAHELCPHSVPKGSADILYTTGTTGRSKGVIISHDAIIADAENLIDGQGFSHDLAFVVNGPLNHIGSLSKLYPLMMLGATAIIVDGLKDLNRFFDAFQYPAPKMATFLVPASIRMLLQFGAAQMAALADKMDFIETGAAAISQTDMAALCRLLPKTRLYNTYASTETGIISTYNYNDGKCVAGCLGRPMKHSQIIITDKGLIACKGRTLMTGYLGAPISDQGQSVALRTLSPLTSDIVLHVIGGGSLNKYLTQFTADACGVEVLAGPQECTAIGNMMLQAKASGDVSDIWAMRQIIANSVEMVAYHPAGDKAAWDKAYQRFLEVSGER